MERHGEVKQDEQNRVAILVDRGPMGGGAGAVPG
tara:strand:- start:24867 stop:24968 length:102 start_codon:yes stop_codon:yes gene_type:complete